MTATVDQPISRNAPLVMLVQDDRPLRVQYAETLRRAGFGVAEAENGVQALELVTVLAPDAIVADLDIPSIDGLAFCRHLRSGPRRRDIPLIVLAARPGPGARAGTVDGDEAADTDARLLKPCTPERLLTEVQYLVGVTAERRDRAARSRHAGDTQRAHVDAGLLDRIRREFDDLPSLRLTVDQAQRLWNVGRDEADALLQALVTDGFLQPAAGERYERVTRSSVDLPRPRMARAAVEKADRRRSDGSRS